MVTYLANSFIRLCIFLIGLLIPLGTIILRLLFWLLVKTKLIYPIAYCLIDSKNPLGLAGFLNAGIGDITIGNIGFIVVIFLSAAALLEEIIQAFMPDFTWSGLIGKER